MNPQRRAGVFRALRILLVIFVPATLLGWALRNAPLTDIWNALQQLQPQQIAALLVLNFIIYVFVTLRWWLVARAELKSLPFLPMIGVRMSVFGISYFTLGPQVGGEPLQVLYLQRKYGMTYTRAASTVLMDKLLEFLANFVLLGIGLTAVLRAGILPTNGEQALVSLSPLAVILAWPIVHIALLHRGIYPVSAGLRAVFPKFERTKWMRFITVAERMAGVFCRRNPRALAMAVAVSLAAAICMVSEYALMTSFLQIHLSFWQTLAAWTAGWLSFLVPVPGGLGALEVSEVFALGAFGFPAASAISVTLLMRARDLVFGGLGLLLAAQAAGRAGNPKFTL